jgi:phosphate transport system substrate-binding protein
LRIFPTLAAASLITAAAIAPAMALDISGAGATFPFPLYAKWAEAYKKETGVGLNYQSVGSAGGLKQIQARLVVFGATDMPLKGPELAQEGLVQFPSALGGVLPVVNIDGVKAGDLVLDGPTLAKIFLGEIKSWNDAAIQKLNPEVKLPSQAITAVHRSDGSGTTFVFTDYLAKVSPDWKWKVGSDAAVKWPAGVGARGSEGVAAAVGKTAAGSIGYVEYAYAKQNKLTYTKLTNKDGKAVAPGIGSFTAAAGSANWEGAPGFGVSPHRRSRRGDLAGHCSHLRPGPQAAEGAGRRARSAQVFLLGVCQGRQAGRRARLRPDSRQCGRRDREGLGIRDQGCERQAGLLDVKIIDAPSRPRRADLRRGKSPADEPGLPLPRCYPVEYSSDLNVRCRTASGASAILRMPPQVCL